MHSDSTDDSAAGKPIASDTEATMKRLRLPITIRPPERDGDRDKLIAALAAAVVAIARARSKRSPGNGDTAVVPHHPKPPNA